MGSLRNPIGPLPSSIYWRRRAVALALLACLVLLTVWALSLNGGRTDDRGKGDDGKGAPSTITPGPTDSGPAITDAPGGRDESETGGDSEGDSGDAGEDGGKGDGDSTGGSGGGSGWEPGGSSAGDAGGKNGGDSSGGTGGGAAVPAGSSLPDCEDSDVTLSLRSVHKEYAAGDKPEFELTAKNKRGTACKLDLGRTATVVTIRDSHGEKLWTSEDCVRDDAGPALFQIPGSGRTVHTFTWYGKPSAANCGKPSKTSVKPGDYEIEVDVKGIKKLDDSFELKKD